MIKLNTMFKNFVIIASLILIIICIPFSVSLVQKQQEIRKFASPSTSIFLQPENITTKVGDSFIINGEINTGNNLVSAARINILYDKSKLKALEIESGTFLSKTLQPGIIDNNKGEAQISLFCENFEPKQGQGTLFKIKFQGISLGNAVVNFSRETEAAAVKEGANVLNLTNSVEVQIAKPSDINGDGVVDILDYNLVVRDFNEDNSPADINRSGKVDIYDFNKLVEDFLKK